MTFRKYISLIAAAAALTAAAVSCSKMAEDGFQDIDGIAYVSTSGSVFNIEDTTPIEGIRVIVNSHKGNEIVERDTVYTNTEGFFKASLSKFKDMSCEIIAEDIDGEEKGGEFESGLISIREIGEKTRSIDNQFLYLTKKK